MAAIKDTAEIARKWSEVTPQRAGEYERGVKNPRRDWAQATSAAESNYNDGVQKAVAEKRFSKGVTRAGTVAWQEGAVTKGVPRFGPGVAGAAEKYRAGYEPYRNAISSLTLPPRYARQDPRNLQRVQSVVSAMIATKKSRG